MLNPCATTTLGTPKKWPLCRGGRYSEFPPIKLVLTLDVWGSGWSLLTVGRCSEVANNTGVPVVMKILVNFVKFDKLSQ